MSVQTTALPHHTRSGGSGGLASILWAVLWGAASCTAALLAFAWVLCQVELPLSAVLPLSTAAVCLGAGSSGFVLGRCWRSNGFAAGLAAGLCCFGLLAGAAWFSGTQEFTALAAIKLACLGLSGALGGVLGRGCRARRVTLK